MDDLEAIRRIIEVLSPFDDRDRARILRWVQEKLLITTSSAASPSSTSDSEILNPDHAIRDAAARGDVTRLKALAKRFRDSNAVHLLVGTAAALAYAGEPEGRDILREMVARSDLDAVAQRAALTGLVQYYVVRDEEAEGLRILEPLLRSASKSFPTPEDQAFFLNQLGRLYWGARRVKEAAEVQSQAARIAPAEPAYHFNLSVVFDKLGHLVEAAVEARQALLLGANDPEHLAHAVQVFTKAQLIEEAKDALAKLEALDPERAHLLARLEPAVAKFRAAMQGGK